MTGDYTMNQVLKKNHGVCSLQKIKEKGENGLERL